MQVMKGKSHRRQCRTANNMNLLTGTLCMPCIETQRSELAGRSILLAMRRNRNLWAVRCFASVTAIAEPCRLICPSCPTVLRVFSSFAQIYLKLLSITSVFALAPLSPRPVSDPTFRAPLSRGSCLTVLLSRASGRDSTNGNDSSGLVFRGSSFRSIRSEARFCRPMIEVPCVQ